MSDPLYSYLFFSLSFIAGVVMIVEGCMILLMKKQIVPLPNRILYGLSVLVAGSEKSRQRFAGDTTPNGLSKYAMWVLVFGPALVISSLVYLFTIL